MQEEDDRTLAFLERRATLDGTVQKHVELAANAAAPHMSVGDPAHKGMRMSLNVDGSVCIFIFPSNPCSSL